jgi:hypothetical protein
VPPARCSSWFFSRNRTENRLASEKVAYNTTHAGVELSAGPSVWLALVFNDMEINRFKGLIAIILRRLGNLERAPKFSG